ncbi:unnamed protein product [Trichobilharzia regenti]|nr:unnamed protein product [Trichobilharzia regenti]
MATNGVSNCREHLKRLQPADSSVSTKSKEKQHYRVRSNSHAENSGWQNLTALECSAVPYGSVICSDHSAFVHLIDPRVKYSKQTGGLRFHSGASLASFLLSKERVKVETPPTNDSNKTSTNAQDIDLKLSKFDI